MEKIRYSIIGCGNIDGDYTNKQKMNLKSNYTLNYRKYDLNYRKKDKRSLYLNQ
jgi:hypothetical protein